MRGCWGLLGARMWFEKSRCFQSDMMGASRVTMSADRTERTPENRLRLSRSRWSQTYSLEKVHQDAV